MCGDPARDLGERLGGDGQLDLAVFLDLAGGGGLEQVVEAGQWFDGEVLVLAGLEGLLDLAEVLLDGDLEVEGATQGEHGDLELLEGWARVVAQQGAERGGVEGVEAGLDDRVELLGGDGGGGFAERELAGGEVAGEGLELGARLLLHDAGDELLLEGDERGELGLGGAAGPEQRGHLHRQDLLAGDAHAGEQDDEADLPVGGGGEDRQVGALAVADDADDNENNDDDDNDDDDDDDENDTSVPLRKLGDGDWLVEVTMVETGEKTACRLSRIAEDPDA
mgnify:CR=1 FL=1